VARVRKAMPVAGCWMLTGGGHFGEWFVRVSKRKKVRSVISVFLIRLRGFRWDGGGEQAPESCGARGGNPRAAVGLRHSRGPGLDARERSRGGEGPGRRCAGGAVGPARALICGGWPINVTRMAGFRKTGLLAANAFFTTRYGSTKYFCEKVF